MLMNVYALQVLLNDKYDSRDREKIPESCSSVP